VGPGGFEPEESVLTRFARSHDFQGSILPGRAIRSSRPFLAEHGSGRVRTGGRHSGVLARLAASPLDGPRRSPRSRLAMLRSRAVTSRIRTRSPFPAAGSSLRSSRGGRKWVRAGSNRSQTIASPRSALRLTGFDPAGTCDSLVTSVPRRIAWVRAGSNYSETCSLPMVAVRVS